jgi:predicted dehydrogenase
LVRERIMARVRVGVVGVGHLGKEHARILAGLPGVELVGVADVNIELARAVASRWSTRPFNDYRLFLDSIDAAVIAVPTAAHHAVAGEFLRRGIHLLVEKPLALNAQQAGELVELAQRSGAVLQVGHIERFNPAFEELLRRPLQPRIVGCQRLSSFTGRSTDIGAVLDLMIHDLDLLLTLVPAPVREVEAFGLTLMGGHEDVAHAHIQFANGCVADVTASRVNPAPFRRMQVWGPEGDATIDFARRQVTLVQPAAVPTRDRPLEMMELDRNQGDQLTRELQDFVRCVQTGDRPRVPGEQGLEAIALADRILARIALHAAEPHSGGARQPLFPSISGDLAA